MFVTQTSHPVLCTCSFALALACKQINEKKSVTEPDEQVASRQTLAYSRKPSHDLMSYIIGTVSSSVSYHHRYCILLGIVSSPYCTIISIVSSSGLYPHRTVSCSRFHGESLSPCFILTFIGCHWRHQNSHRTQIKNKQA